VVVPWTLAGINPPAKIAAENGWLFEPFIYKNDHFAKTGSGQT
jgi:hypothetical protein